MKPSKIRFFVTAAMLGSLFAILLTLTTNTPPLMARQKNTAPAVDANWLTTGNRIQDALFLGTKNNKPLIFKTKKVERMRIDTNGRVGIGTASPAAPLDVASGRIRLSAAGGDVEFTEVADLIAYTTQPSPVPGSPAFRLHTGTGLANVFSVLNNGNVGIGDPNPGGRLIVKGDGSTFLLRVQDQTGADKLKVVNNGVVSFGALYSLSSTNHLCYHAPANLALTSCSSAAEYVPTIDGGSGFPGAADLVSIAPNIKNPYGDAHGPFVVQKSTMPCDNNLLGFIVKPESGADGIKLNDHYLPLAIYGYFPAKVTTKNGSIRRGDPLTSSSRPGYAMKATGACKIIGYALEDASTDGEIQVFADLGENSTTRVVELEHENQLLKEQLTAIEGRLAALEGALPVTQNVRAK